MDELARTNPIIYVAIKDHQVYHQSDVAEVEGNIAKKTIFILIDNVSTHSYITPKIVEICAFKKTNHIKSWLVQLATRIKRKVNEMVENCPLEMGGLLICKNINTFLLASYDNLIGMD